MDRPQLHDSDPDRIAALEARVAQLELALGQRQAPVQGVRSPRPATGATRPSQTIELQLGLTWLNRVGAAAVVLALVFAAVWAHDHGLLSAGIRTALATLTALGALAAGLWLSRSRERSTQVFAYGFQVIGAIGLYVICFSVSHIDHLLTPGGAMAAACLLTIALSGIADKMQLASLANLGALGGLSVPLLSHADSARFAPVFVFLSSQAFVHLWLARKNRWGQVALIECLGLSLYFLYLAANAGELAGPGQCAAMSLVLGFFVCLYLRDELFADGAGETDRLAAWLALLGSIGCWSLLGTERSPLLSVGAAALALVCLAALGALMHRHPTRPRTAGPALMAVLVLLSVGLGEGAGLKLLILAGPAALLLLSLLREDDPIWLSLRALAIVVLPLGLWSLVASGDFSQIACAELLLAGFFLHWPLWRFSSARKMPSLRPLAALSGHCMGVLALVLCLDLAQSGPALITIAPALYGLLLVYLGGSAEDQWTRYIGLFFIGSSVVKVSLVDVWSLSAGGRVGAFLCLGALLMGGSFLYSRRARFESWAARPNP